MNSHNLWLVYQKGFALQTYCLILVCRFFPLCVQTEGRLLGQSLRSTLFYYLHTIYAIVVLSFCSVWLIVCAFRKVGRNVLGVKSLRGEMSFEVKSTGVKCLGWNVFRLKCPDTGYFICQNKHFKELESRVPKLSKQTMQALQILTNFGSFRKKAWQWCKITKKKLHNLLVLAFS